MLLVLQFARVSDCSGNPFVQCNEAKHCSEKRGPKATPK